MAVYALKKIEAFEVFPWNTNLETGISVIDEQHKQLVHLLNTLASYVSQHGNDFKLQEVFDELTAYADYHFKTEESIWEPHFKDDIWYQEHQKTHDSFLKKIADLQNKGTQLTKEQVIDDILKFLIGWLAFHILDNDKRMSLALHAINKGQSIEQAKITADREMSGATRLLIETVLNMYEDISSRTIELMRERSERRTLEYALQESEKRERSFSDAVMKAMPGLIALYDNQNQLVRWNKHHEKYTGYTGTELEKKSFLDMFATEDHTEILDTIQQLHSQGSIKIEKEIISKDGNKTPFLLTGVHLDVETENYFLISGIDISNIKHVENNLRASQSRYNEAQRIAHLGHWEVDHATSEFILSDEVYDIFERKPDDFHVSYETILDAIHPDDKSMVNRIYSESIAKHIPYEMTHRLVMSDGRIKYVRQRGNTTYSDEGKSLTSFGTVHDITKDILSEQALEDKTSQLQDALIGVISSVSKALESRDPYTSGHQNRVAKIAVAIAKRMGLDDNQIQGLHLGASIHDIGKMAIPAELLSKPSRLTEVEYMLIKTHAQTGADILKNVKFPWPIIEIAQQHHERLDGSGYPNGLQGDEICLEAKIVAVADVFEAMSSHRPYRPGLGPDKAIEEITRNRGKFYDPAAVDALLSLLDEDKERFVSS